MKIKFYKVKEAEKIAKEIMEKWPPFLPNPKVEIVDTIICDEPFILVGKDVKINCAYFVAKPNVEDIIAKAIELAFAKTEKITTSRTLISGKMAERFIGFPSVESSCLASYGCVQCIDSCPFNAITIVEGKISINNAKCTNCGLCSASCPIGAISLSYPTWNSITILTKVKKKGEKLRISCDNEADFKVPCLGVLGPEELYVLQSFFDVDLYCPNEKCVNRIASRKTEELFKEVKEKLKEKHDASLIGVKRSDYTKIITNSKIEGISNYDIHSYNVIVTSNCTLCGVCVRKCPAGALNYSIEGEKIFLKFIPAKCVGCNICVNACEEGTIFVLKGNRYLNLNNEQNYVVAEDEVVTCRKCGRPFDNKKKIIRVSSILGVPKEELEYCNECKQSITAEKILKSWKDRFGDVRRSKI